ncbi:unnamed protein product [Caenorhabditis angaria]|uniref:Uncharacterized protein n=1 Tax=Caenorhabditis angaria TaxID=860376 RepID=A0A9P1N7M4_9PELO|nr:unnamed protein product [Caenorhabditis angaria]
MSSQNNTITDQNIDRGSLGEDQIDIEQPDNLAESTDEYELLRYLMKHFDKYSKLTKDPAFEMAIKILSTFDQMIKSTSEAGKIDGKGAKYSSRGIAQIIDKLVKDNIFNFPNLENMYFRDEVLENPESNSSIIPEEGEEILEEQDAPEHVVFRDAATCEKQGIDFFGEKNNFGIPPEIQVMNGYEDSPVSSRCCHQNDKDFEAQRKRKEILRNMYGRLSTYQKRRKSQENRELEYYEQLQTSMFIHSEYYQNTYSGNHDCIESRPSSSGHNLGATACSSDMEIETDEDEREDGELRDTPSPQTVLCVQNQIVDI